MQRHRNKFIQIKVLQSRNVNDARHYEAKTEAKAQRFETNEKDEA